MADIGEPKTEGPTAAGFEIKKFPEGTSRLFIFAVGKFYRLADGSLIPLYATLGWCRKCEDYAEVESLGNTVAEIDQRLAELHDPSSDIYIWAEESWSGPGGPFRHKEIAKWQRQRKWRESRIEAAKCLLCGSTDVIVLPMGEEIPCPFSTGTLFIEGIGPCDTVFNNWFFSSEGDRLGSDENQKV